MLIEALESRVMLAGAAPLADAVAPTPEVALTLPLAPTPAAVRFGSPPLPRYGTITSGGQSFSVGLVRADGGTAPLDPNRQVWIVIHGWNSGPALVDPLADAIQAGGANRQVVEFDWSSAASDPNVVTVAFRVPDVAQYIIRRMTNWSIPTAKINLVGHSLGGYMAGAIAKGLGGVNKIVVLDPATIDIGGFNLSGVDYARDSRYSVAFIASSFSTPSSAFTADETVRANVGPYDNALTHLNVLNLFTAMTWLNSNGQADAVSALFAIPRLNQVQRPAFTPDAEGDGYDEVLTGQVYAGWWVPASLSYVDRFSGQPVTIGP